MVPDGFPFKLEMDEEIKQIEKFPDYWISNYGRVFSYKNNGYRKLSNKTNNNKVPTIKLFNKFEKIYISLAKLVYLNFIGNIPKNYCIHHKDKNINNNNINNLVCVSKSEISSLYNVNKRYNSYKEINANTIQGTISNGSTFLIDKEDYDKIFPYSWHKHKDGYMRTRISSYKDKNGKTHNSYILMHNLIMGKKKGLELDHLNGDPADNRKSNLQYKTHFENMDNVVGYVGNKIKGTYYSKRERKWKALITYKNAKYYLGTFDNYDEAELAIKNKRNELNLGERKRNE